MYFCHHSNATVQVIEAEHFVSKLTKCILAFRFIDHLMVMFAELPPWDLEKKYLPNNLEVRSLTFLQFQGCCVVDFFYFWSEKVHSFEGIKVLASVYHAQV